MAISSLTQIISRIDNFFRLSTLPSHRRKVRTARQVLSTIRTFEGPMAGERAFSYLRQVNPNVFEELVLTALEDAGFRVSRGLRYSGDGGSDGEVKIPGLGWVSIQSKRYANHISAQHVKDFGALLARRRHPLGLFVHTGMTGALSKETAHANGIQVLSGNLLLRLLCEGQLHLPRHVFA